MIRKKRCNANPFFLNFDPVLMHSFREELQESLVFSCTCGKTTLSVLFKQSLRKGFEFESFSRQIISLWNSRTINRLLHRHYFMIQKQQCQDYTVK